MSSRMRLVLVLGLFVAAVVLLMVITTGSSGNYYVTIKELQEMDAKDKIGQRFTVTGLVDGDTIAYDTNTATTTFTLVHLTSDEKVIAEHDGGLEALIAEAWAAPEAQLRVVYANVKPDALKPGVQALVRGYYEADGTFSADEIILQCPSKYVAMPEQALPEDEDE